MISTAPTEASPEQLARQCQAGCRDSFALLVEQFGERILNFLLQLVGNRHDAEDLTQETFLKAYQNIHRFDPAYTFSTWLFTIAKRTAFSHFRAAKVRQTPVEEPDVEWRDPAVALAEKDETQSLRAVARRLKSSQYEALWLAYGEGFSIAETARVMHTNQLRVRVLLHRGRAQLGKWLKSAEADKTATRGRDARTIMQGDFQ